MGHKEGERPALAAPSVVEKFEVAIRKPAFSGESFGDVGAYEFISGVATVRVDPRNPANGKVVDLDKAIESDGFVRFQTDVAILRPVNPTKASRVFIVDIPNRGNKLALGRLADGGSQYDTAAQAGNGWPMRQGHTFAWIGWQGDVPLGKEGKSIGTKFPIATSGGNTLTGWTIEEFVFDNEKKENVGELTYPTSDLDTSHATLTAQSRSDSTPVALPSSAWRYVNAGKIEITRPQEFDAGVIYRLTYKARDPMVMGLGLVALRDVSVFLESGLPDAAGQKNPLADIHPETRILFGISQSGRFLRDFIWYGFNESANGKKVFDAAMPIIAGSRKSYVNIRFSQPGRYSRQHEDHIFYGDQFPFTYATTTDPISGKTDGIFSTCEKDRTCPKLMQRDSSLEFWQARASLLASDGLGRAVPVSDNVRLYLMAGTQHASALKSSYGICQQPSNPATQAPIIRAALVRLIEWARDGKTPPPSRFPMPGNGLVQPEQTAVGFPDLSGIGVQFPKRLNTLNVVDYSVFPPVVANRSYTVLVPRADKDGQDIDGVRLPEIEVPLATHTGWNLRKQGFAEGELCNINGSYLPLSPDPATRESKKDPRRSLLERYGSKHAYLEAFKDSGARLSRDGFLLQEDLDRMLANARKDPLISKLPD